MTNTGEQDRPLLAILRQADPAVLGALRADTDHSVAEVDRANRQPEGVPTPSPDWASSKTAGSSDRETHAWSIIGLERAAGD